jgi:hypothetical protein
MGFGIAVTIHFEEFFRCDYKTDMPLNDPLQFHIGNRKPFQMPGPEKPCPPYENLDVTVGWAPASRNLIFYIAV